MRLFLRNLTHELSGPLTPLAGHVELLSGHDQSGLSPLQKRCINALERATKRLRRFNDQVLEVARLERGAHRVKLEETDLEALIRQAVEQCRLSLEKGGVEATVEPVPPELAHPGAGNRIRTDETLLKKMVVGLVENSAAFCPEGSEVRIEARAVTPPENDQPEGGEPTRRLELRVEDNGPGVPPDSLEDIFRPFFRVGPPARTIGPGLGLTGVRLAAHLLRGTVRAELADPGLRVILTLPLHSI
jgi:signal transduction histidine kinase